MRSAAPPPVTVRPATDADRAAWDGFVLGRAQGNLLQTWGWAELKREYGWEVERRLALTPSGDLVGAMHVLLRPGPLGVRFAYVPRGPAVADLARDRAAVLAMLREAAALARRRRALVLKADPEWPADDPAAAALAAAAGLRDSPYDVQHRLTYLVDLSGGADAVLARVKPATRRAIRLAEREGVSVDVGGLEAVDEFFPLFRASAERGGFVGRDLAYHRAVVRHLSTSCPVAVLLARHDGRAAAGMVAVAAGPRLVYLFGGTDHGRPQPHAAYLLHWAAIRWGQEHGAAVYDMWGVPNHEDPARAGYYEFKRRWNGEVARHRRCQDVPLWPWLGPLPRLAERVALRGRPLLT